MPRGVRGCNFNSLQFEFATEVIVETYENRFLRSGQRTLEGCRTVGLLSFVVLLLHLALFAQEGPPQEQGPFREPELVELVSLDPTLHLDIRYATSDNLAKRPVYREARAFLQRPAAEALIRAHHSLKVKGYGLLIFDGYRPWSVTKIFWDITPPEKHLFVANPVEGSKHNRGCAVDLSLYDLKTSRPIEMPSTYDEMSERSYPTYQGGTAAQRAARDPLRSAMERQGFTVYPTEWWHFDYKGWNQYPILNLSFSEIKTGKSSSQK
jgi:D-alanyl-D-alanine dipeptidase